MRENDLKFFENILKSRKEQIQKNLDSVSLESEGLSTLEINDEGDYASLSTDTLIDTSITKQQQSELLEIEAALGKIKNGTYGICEMCEESIGIPRLKVKPHAKYCIVCREISEKKPK